jgi:hypothetical protein
MAYGVNINLSNWRATGANVQVPQYEITIDIEWHDDSGTLHNQSRTVQFPNFLTQLPTSWVGEKIKELLIQGVREFYEVDK